MSQTPEDEKPAQEAPVPLDPAALIDAQYEGGKQELRPIYDALEHIARKLGKGVRIEPATTHVVFSRKRPFAVVKAATRTRVDLGLALEGIAPTVRLKKARNFAGIEGVTHKLDLLFLEEVDADVVLYMKRAWELAGKAPPKPAVALAPSEEEEQDGPIRVPVAEDRRTPQRPPAKRR